ncbi:2-oxoglutarate and iron-dependent oxygenase JMJD4 [Prorops nasuta]|uniref:2-oxoglutarate and iron-dependent oxygenase JMJD4 n=1 Tax=Prorops nasuta TaxID=863751 RepID=UPI0034CE87BC
MSNVFDISKETNLIDKADQEEEKLEIKLVDPTISYDTFFNQFFVKNVPCIISSEITENWPCKKQWVLDNAPNFGFLEKVFGHNEAPVANCNEKYYNSQSKQKMLIADYLKYWKGYKDSNYNSKIQLLYLKDWHCIQNFPNIAIYNVPKYFLSDWLNEYYIAHPELKDDYMFVYMGPRGSWTPFHADVFTSYSWSANIVGRKRWLLFPPGEEYQLCNLHGQLIYDATSEELFNKSIYNQYNSETLKHYDIIQESGQAIFIPSGWHHQVWNLEDTISINHNCINGCNIWIMWMALKKEFALVIREVEDCKNMENWREHCQLMLKTSYGMDYIQFYDFLSFIAKRRLNSIVEGNPIISFKNYKLGANQSMFDLRSLKTVLEDFIAEVQDKSLYSLICKSNELHDLLKSVTSIL